MGTIGNLVFTFRQQACLHIISENLFLFFFWVSQCNGFLKIFLFARGKMCFPAYVIPSLIVKGVTSCFFLVGFFFWVRGGTRTEDLQHRNSRFNDCANNAGNIMYEFIESVLEFPFSVFFFRLFSSYLIPTLIF